MNKIIVTISVYCYLTYISCSLNVTTKHTLDDDYYINYDYEITTNNTDNVQMKSDSLILPNPETIDAKYTLDVLPNVELPDDSLADTDLRDHDFIDNLMYVYYGSHTKYSNSYGPEIIIIGSVLSCAAQLLTIFCIILNKNLNVKKEMNTMFLHLMGCLCISNLLFMLGVYATKSIIRCQILAVILHYLHLLTAFWIFLYCYYIYKRFSNSNIPKIKYLFFLAYGLPAVLSLVSFVIAPRSYETKKFCFVSVQKGMIINYMLPVSILIITTTIYSLNGIRKINLELSKLELTSSAESLNALKNEVDGIECDKKQDSVTDNEIVSLRECKSCLKAMCIIQTSYDIVWFVAVLALENVNYSNSMSIVYSISSCILNWYIFGKTKSFLPSITARTQLPNDQFLINDQEKVVASLSSRGSSDSIPLLVNSENCTEMRELRHDYISTISN